MCQRPAHAGRGAMAWLARLIDLHRLCVNAGSSSQSPLQPQHPQRERALTPALRAIRAWRRAMLIFDGAFTGDQRRAGPFWFTEPMQAQLQRARW